MERIARPAAGAPLLLYPLIMVMEGEVVGPYRLVRLVGEGGMGSVYEAVPVRGGERVAMKILKEGLVDRETFVKRFFREAQSAARVRDPNLVAALDAGVDRDYYYFIMEFIEGESLKERLRHGERLEAIPALHLAREIAKALRALHQAAIVHRDLKPANIIVDREGAVRLADFGLAGSHDDAFAHLDRDVLGTPAYMSPEQLRGEPLDIRSDIYALGATLFHLTAGRPPYIGESPRDIALKIRSDENGFHPAEVAAGIPLPLAGLIERMMSRDPSARPQDPSELIAAIDAVIEQMGGVVPEREEVGEPADAAAARGGGGWLLRILAGGVVAMIVLIIALLVGGRPLLDHVRSAWRGSGSGSGAPGGPTVGGPAGTPAPGVPGHASGPPGSKTTGPSPDPVVRPGPGPTSPTGEPSSVVVPLSVDLGPLKAEATAVVRHHQRIREVGAKLLAREGLTAAERKEIQAILDEAAKEETELARLVADRARDLIGNGKLGEVPGLLEDARTVRGLSSAYLAQIRSIVDREREKRFRAEETRYRDARARGDTEGAGAVIKTVLDWRDPEYGKVAAKWREDLDKALAAVELERREKLDGLRRVFEVALRERRYDAAARSLESAKDVLKALDAPAKAAGGSADPAAWKRFSLALEGARRAWSRWFEAARALGTWEVPGEGKKPIRGKVEPAGDGLLRLGKTQIPAAKVPFDDVRYATDKGPGTAGDALRDLGLFALAEGRPGAARAYLEAARGEGAGSPVEEAVTAASDPAATRDYQRILQERAEDAEARKLYAKVEDSIKSGRLQETGEDIRLLLTKYKSVRFLHPRIDSLQADLAGIRRRALLEDEAFHGGVALVGDLPGPIRSKSHRVRLVYEPGDPEQDPKVFIGDFDFQEDTWRASRIDRSFKRTKTGLQHGLRLKVPFEGDLSLKITFRSLSRASLNVLAAHYGKAVVAYTSAVNGRANIWSESGRAPDLPEMLGSPKGSKVLPLKAALVFDNEFRVEFRTVGIRLWVNGVSCERRVSGVGGHLTIYAAEFLPIRRIEVEGTPDAAWVAKTLSEG